MIAVSTSPVNISMLRKTNVWYTVKDGNWNDPDVWVSNGKRKDECPGINDDVVIYNTVSYNNNLTSTYLFSNVINDLTIFGQLTSNESSLNQNRLIVKGNLKCTGVIDFSNTVDFITLELRGLDNFVNSFVSGTKSSIYYNSQLNQTVLPIVYSTLEIGNSNIKSISQDLTVADTLYIDSEATLELGLYNSTFNICNLQGTLTKKSSFGSVNFNNNINIIDSTGSINFLGNPVINLSGDITCVDGDMRGGFNFGSGTINILNNQTWTLNTAGNNPVSVGNGNILIGSDKTLSISSPSGNSGGLYIGGTASINGLAGTSTLNIDSCFAYGNLNIPMSTGIFNHNNSNNSQIIVWAGVSMNLLLTVFYDLSIYGTATLTADTTIYNDVNVSSGTLQLADFDFTVINTTSYDGLLAKSGIGTVSLNALMCQNSTGSISFVGNPTVNLSGNISGDVRNGFNLGLGNINIVNNLTIAVWVSGNLAPTINCDILIASGKTLTNIGINSTTGGIIALGEINGIDSTSIFDNRSILLYNNTTGLMETGKLYCNQSSNTVIYGCLGDQDIQVPDDIIPGYQALTLSGSGVKRLLGDISVKGIYMISSPATLNLNGYNLTNP